MNDFTVWMPCKVSSAMVLAAASSSVTFLLSFLINLPNITAPITITGKVLSITKVSLVLVTSMMAMPTTRVVTCLINSARVKESTSCSWPTSDVIRLVRSPTRRCSKKGMGKHTILLYTSSLISRKVRSLTWAKTKIRKKLKTACSTKMAIRPRAIVFLS